MVGDPKGVPRKVFTTKWIRNPEILEKYPIPHDFIFSFQQYVLNALFDK